MSEPTSPTHHISPSDLKVFVHNVLIANGVPDENAATVADCLVQADLRGVDTHGTNRIPSYMERIRQKVDASKPADVGHFLVAIKPDLFLSIDEFKERMDYLYRRVVGCEKMEGVDRIYYPGETLGKWHPFQRT